MALDSYNGYSISSLSIIPLIYREYYFKEITEEVFKEESFDFNSQNNSGYKETNTINFYGNTIPIISNSDLLYLLLVSTPNDEVNQLIEFDKKYKIQEAVLKYSDISIKINVSIWFNEIITNEVEVYSEKAIKLLEENKIIQYSKSKFSVQGFDLKEEFIEFKNQESIGNYIVRRLSHFFTEEDVSFNNNRLALETLNTGSYGSFEYGDLVYVLYEEDLDYSFFKRKAGESEIISSSLLAVLSELHGDPDILIRNIVLGSVGLVFGISEILIALEAGISELIIYSTIVDFGASSLILAFEFLPEETRAKYADIENVAACINLLNLVSNISKIAFSSNKLRLSNIISEVGDFLNKCSVNALKVLEFGYIKYNQILVKTILTLCKSGRIRVFLIKKSIHVMSYDGKFMFTLNPEYLITKINSNFSLFETTRAMFDKTLKNVKIVYVNSQGKKVTDTIDLDYFSSKNLSIEQLKNYNSKHNYSFRIRLSKNKSGSKYDSMLYNKLHEMSKGFPPAKKGIAEIVDLEFDKKYYAFVDANQIGKSGELIFVNWITDEKFSNLKDLRNRLSLLKDFKDPQKSKCYFIEIEFIDKGTAVKSIVGPLEDELTGLHYTGQANQWEILFHDKTKIKIIDNFEFDDFVDVKKYE